eukprot:258163-Hanusia_phi.AAC.1
MSNRNDALRPPFLSLSLLHSSPLLRYLDDIGMIALAMHTDLPINSVPTCTGTISTRARSEQQLQHSHACLLGQQSLGRVSPGAGEDQKGTCNPQSSAEAGMSSCSLSACFIRFLWSLVSTTLTSRRLSSGEHRRGGDSFSDSASAGAEDGRKKFLCGMAQQADLAMAHDAARAALLRFAHLLSEQQDSER